MESHKSDKVKSKIKDKIYSDIKEVIGLNQKQKRV